MRRYGTPLLALILLVGLGCWGKGALLARGLTGYPEGYLLRYRAPVELPAAALVELEGSDSRFALASEGADVWIHAPFFDREARVTSLTVLGDPALLFPFQSLVAGSYPTTGEECLVDEKTALALWGATDATGMTLTLGDRECTVTGVVESALPLFLRPKLTAEGFSYTLAAYLPDTGDPFPRQSLDAFLGAHYLETPAGITDGAFVTALLFQMAMIPLWILCLPLAGALARALAPGKGWGWRWLRRLLWLALLVLVGRVLLFSPALTAGMIPSQWSDFSFWSESLRTLGDALSTRVSLVAALPEALFYRRLIPPLLWAGGSFLLLLQALALWCARRKALR